jgi:hypothetical protein
MIDHCTSTLGVISSSLGGYDGCFFASGPSNRRRGTVAPRAEARIETYRLERQQPAVRSLPVRERGSENIGFGVEGDLL